MKIFLLNSNFSKNKLKASKQTIPLPTIENIKLNDDAMMLFRNELITTIRILKNEESCPVHFY